MLTKDGLTLQAPRGGLAFIAAWESWEVYSSLELLARQRPAMICPGHGQLIHDGVKRIQWYIDHRQTREEQIIKAVSGGAGSVDEVVQAVYPRNLRKNLRSAAARNVTTHLAKLLEEGTVSQDAATHRVN